MSTRNALRALLGAACALQAAALAPRKTPWAGQMGKQLASAAIAAAVGSGVMTTCPQPGVADGQTEKFRLPPIDRSDKRRCTFSSSAIGQANAARDKLYDLRECDMRKKDAEGFDLSGAILSGADFSGTNFRDARMSKAYAEGATFDNADFTNAVVDRVSFKGSSMKGARFGNAVLTGSNFDDVNLENVDFTGAYIGKFDIKKICANPTLKGTNAATGEDTYESVGGCP